MVGARHSTEKWDNLIQSVMAQRIRTFANTSPNPYSTRIFTSDGQKVLSAFQYEAPESVLRPNQEALAKGTRQYVTDQPGRPRGGLGSLKDHLLPVSVSISIFNLLFTSI